MESKTGEDNTRIFIFGQGENYLLGIL